MSIMKTCKVGKVVTTAKLNANVSAVERSFIYSVLGFVTERPEIFVLEAVHPEDRRRSITSRKLARFVGRIFGLSVTEIPLLNAVAETVSLFTEADYYQEKITGVGKVGSLNEPMLREGKSVMLLEKKARVRNVDRQLTFTDIICMATNQIKQSLRYFVSIAMPEGIEV